MSEAIAITGAGAVSALGVGVRALASALDGAKSGIREIARFSTREFSTNLGAIVPGFETREDGALAVEYALMAAREALESARVPSRGFGDASRVALVLGSSLGSGRARLAELTEEIARALGVAGPRVTVSTACTSSANAVGLARDLLDAGACDLALAGGSDVLTPALFAGFHALGVLGKQPCAPFGLPTGTTLGEGAGFVVLERAPDAAARGAAPLAWLHGYGLSCDAYHATSPDPTGSGIARAIACALADAGADAPSIGWVNAHGTGTETNDAAEVLGIVAALGARVPMSSSKSFLGHAQGAAGILELLVTIEALRAQRLAPTVNLRARRRGAPADPVSEPRAASFDRALSVNAAFAGANSAVVVGSAPHRAARADTATALVVLGAASAHDGEDLAAAIPMADTRGLDPSSRMIALACARALAAAGVSPKGALRDRVGVVAATSAFSAAAHAEFQKSVAERGLPKLNASAFAKLVQSSPTGAAARLLSLRGPTSTLTTGLGGGVVAIAYAATLLAGARVDLVEHLLGAAFDERGHASDPPDARSAAAALVLGRADSVHYATKTRLVSWAIGAPGEIGERACAERVLGGRATGATLGCDAAAPSASGAIACARADAMIQSGEARSVLVTTAGGGASAALLFEAGSA